MRTKTIRCVVKCAVPDNNEVVLVIIKPDRFMGVVPHGSITRRQVTK